MYVADAHLRNANGAIAYPAGSEVPEHVLKSPMAKAHGWKDLVSEVRTKTVRADGAGTTKPVPADPAS